MSNERKPILSDEAAISLICSIDESPWKTVRDHYERLIAEGKLLVVEEVETVPILSFIGWEMQCGSCGTRVGNVYEKGIMSYCPGCGNKIKR